MTIIDMDKLEGWEFYNSSACPLTTCSWSITTSLSVDTDWLEKRLNDHVSSHQIIEWVADVVYLKDRLRRLAHFIEERLAE